MPPKKERTKKPMTTAVDFGFGRGERIRSWIRPDRPKRVIWGVERSLRKREKRLRIKGAHVSHLGMIGWLKRQRNASIKVVNGDFILNNLFDECYRKGKAKYVDVLKLLKRRLKPNGRVYFTAFKRSSDMIIYLMTKAGFRLSLEREIKGRGQTHFIRKHLKKEKDSPPVRFVFRPGEPTQRQRQSVFVFDGMDDGTLGKKINELIKEALAGVEKLNTEEFIARSEIGRFGMACDMLGKEPPRVDLVNKTAAEELARLKKEYGDLPEIHAERLKKYYASLPLLKLLKESLEEPGNKGKKE